MVYWGPRADSTSLVRCLDDQLTLDGEEEKERKDTKKKKKKCKMLISTFLIRNYSKFIYSFSLKARSFVFFQI